MKRYFYMFWKTSSSKTYKLYSSVPKTEEQIRGITRMLGRRYNGDVAIILKNKNEYTPNPENILQ